MKKEEKKKLKKLYCIISILVFLMIFIDQLAKVLVIHYGEITVISNTFVLKPNEYNNGIYDETTRGITIMTNIVIVCIILGMIRSNNQFVTNKTKVLLSFALAGGISNIIDRICRGGVVEYIHITNFPALNIADICIAIGWISFVAIFASFSAKEFTKNKSNRKEKIE